MNKSLRGKKNKKKKRRGRRELSAEDDTNMKTQDDSHVKNRAIETDSSETSETLLSLI